MCGIAQMGGTSGKGNTIDCIGSGNRVASGR